jgi:hypothetical protein
MKKNLPLLFLIVFVTAFCVAGLLIRNVNSQSKEIIVEKKRVDQPVVIAQIQTKNIKSDLRKSFAKSATWYEGLEIKIENVSEKPISYLSLDLVFKRSKNIVAKSKEDSLPFGQIIKYGDKDNPTEVKIAPKETATITLDKVHYETLNSYLLSLGYPENFDGVEIEVKEIIFTDNSVWFKGVWSKKLI